MDKNKPLPPRALFQVAYISSKTIYKVVCPYCEYTWEVVEESSTDFSKEDAFEDVFQCPSCSQWMASYDDEVMIDMFYEDFDGEDYD